MSEASLYRTNEELKNTSGSSISEITPIIASVLDRSFIEKTLKKFAVDTVYHSAAYKHVPLMETNVLQCVKNNFLGTVILADTAIKAGVSNFTLISTDKAVNPTNFMGASKRLAELACLSRSKSHATTSFSIVRFGNVLGSSGSVVPLFEKQLKRGGPLTVTHAEITRYFMTIEEAAQLVIQAASLAKGGEIFVLDMGEPIKILDLATKMVELSGHQPYLLSADKRSHGDIEIQITGLRPGEKLFEELSYGGRLAKTSHSRIFEAIEDNGETTDFGVISTEILNALAEDDLHKIMDTIRRLVPTLG